MPDKELLDELVKRSVIDQTIADTIFRDAQLTESSPEELLYRKKLADEVAVAKVKAELIGAPYKKIDVEAIPEELLAIIPKETSQNYRVVPLEKRDGMVWRTVLKGSLNEVGPQTSPAYTDTTVAMRSMEEALKAPAETPPAVDVKPADLTPLHDRVKAIQATL